MTNILDQQLKINKYDIQIEISDQIKTFEANTTISLHVEKALDTILLNAKNLEIKEISILEDPQLNLSVTKLNKETISIQCESGMLEKGEYTISIAYVGQIGTKGVGVYSMHIDDHQLIKSDGSKADMPNWIIATQGEATYSRLMFPCIDDPNFRTPIDFKLIIPNSFKEIGIIANETEKERIEKNNKLEISFNTTKPIPSYLFAFAVGALSSSRPVNTELGEQRIWSVPAKQNQIDYALEIAKDSTTILFEMLGENSLCSKVDHIALPEFIFGGMENPGCITYRESALLIDEEFATKLQKLRVMSVISHELSHMWFGNQIGLASWDYTYLKEGAAKWLETTTCEKLFENKLLVFEDDMIGIDNAQIAAMAENEKPIEKIVESVEEADSNYSYTTYYKTLALLNHVQQFSKVHTKDNAIEDAFKYLSQNYSFKTITVDNYWEALPDDAIIVREQFKENILPIINISLPTDTNESGVFLRGNFSTSDSLNDFVKTEDIWYCWDRFAVFIYENDIKIIDNILDNYFNNELLLTMCKDIWWSVRLDKTKLSLWKYFIEKSLTHKSKTLESQKLLVRELNRIYSELCLLTNVEEAKSWIKELVLKTKMSELENTPEYLSLFGDILDTRNEELVLNCKNHFNKTHNDSSPEHFVSAMKVLCKNEDSKAIEYAFDLLEKQVSPQITSICLQALTKSKNIETFERLIEIVGTSVRYSDVPSMLLMYWQNDSLANSLFDYLKENWSNLREHISDTNLCRIFANCFLIKDKNLAKELLNEYPNFTLELSKNEADAGIALLNKLLS